MRIRRVLSLIILMMMMAACNPTVSTVTPAAISTIESVALPEKALLQDTVGGELTMQHPAGWVTRGEKEAIRLVLATSQTLMDSDDAQMGENEIQVTVSASPLSMAAGAVEEDVELNSETFLDALLTQVKAISTTLEFSSIAPVTIGGKSAALVRATAPEREVILIAIEKEEAYILVIANTRKGSLTTHEALILQMAASADYVTAAE